MKKILLSLLIVSLFANCQVENENHDFIVIGGGLMGSATAWQLSNAGQKVLLLEKQDSIYTSGSSFGEARISRSLGPVDDIFSYLQQRGVAETEELIAFLNQDNQLKPHAMEDVYTTSPVTYILYDQGQIDQLHINQQDPHELASTPTTAKEMFDMHIADTMQIIREFKTHSGTMNPRELIHKLHVGIQKHNNKVQFGSSVIHIQPTENGYSVEYEDTKTLTKQTVNCKKIAVAAGPYNPEVLKEIAPYFQELIQPKRVFLGFYTIKPESYALLSAGQQQRLLDYFPVADLTPEIMFAMVEKTNDNASPLLKIGGHLIREDITDLDKVWQKELSPDEKAWSHDKLLAYLKIINLPVSSEDLVFEKGYSCVYSLTTSEVPLVTPVIKTSGDVDENMVVLGGMSGIGAKGTMTYGLIGSNLLLGKTEQNKMYQLTSAALGEERLRKHLSIGPDKKIDDRWKAGLW